MKAEQAEIKELLKILCESRKAISEGYQQYAEIVRQRNKDDQMIKELKKQRGL